LALLRLGAAAEAGVASVDGRRAIASTGEDFVCATLDWWPPDKCDYGTCSWGRASLLNLVAADVPSPLPSTLNHRRRRTDASFFFAAQDLSNKILLNAVRGRLSSRRPCARVQQQHQIDRPIFANAANNSSSSQRSRR
jgi:hypothetical protein